MRPYLPGFTPQSSNSTQRSKQLAWGWRTGARSGAAQTGRGENKGLRGESRQAGSVEKSATEFLKKRLSPERGSQRTPRARRKSQIEGVKTDRHNGQNPAFLAEANIVWQKHHSFSNKHLGASRFFSEDPSFMLGVGHKQTLQIVSDLIPFNRISFVMFILRTPSPEQDSEHLTAAQQGNLEVAAEMVKKAASEAGFTYGPLYRSQNGKRDRMVDSMMGGIYFHPDKATASLWAADNSPIESVFIDPGLIKYSRETSEGTHRSVSGINPKTGLEGQDADTVVRTDDSLHVFEVTIFDMTRAVSADPVALDLDGKILPLSARFVPLVNQRPPQDTPPQIERITYLPPPDSSHDVVSSSKGRGII